MNRIARRAVTVAAALALGVVACGPGKIAQCNKLIEKVNAAGTAIQKAGNASSGNAAELAKSIDATKGDVAGVELKDPKLKGFQADYVKMLDEVSGAAKALQAAEDKKDQAAILAGSVKLKTAAAQETVVTTNINTYCGGA